MTCCTSESLFGFRYSVLLQLGFLTVDPSSSPPPPLKANKHTHTHTPPPPRPVMTHDTWGSIVFSQLENAGKWMFEHFPVVGCILLSSALTALKDPQSSNWCYGWGVCCSGRLSDRSRDRKWRHSQPRTNQPTLTFISPAVKSGICTDVVTNKHMTKTNRSECLERPCNVFEFDLGFKALCPC